MKALARIITTLVSFTVISIACGPGTSEGAQTAITAVPSPAAASATPAAIETDGEPAGAALVQASFPALPDATYDTNGDITVVKVPVTDCATVTATPIVVGDYLVMPMHDSGHGCEPRGPYADTLLGYSFTDNQLHLLYDGYTGEATPYYDVSSGLVFWNVTFGGAVAVLDASTFMPVTTVNVQTVSDSSGVLLNGLYYFGTINTPEASCQDPINPNCGSIFAAQANGTVVDQINLDEGFRSWIGAGLTTDGQYIYAGGGPQHNGATESEYLYGCSAVKLDQDLTVVASADPGDPGCHRTGLGLNDEDAVAGELVLGPDSVWVQFAHATDSRNQATLIRYDRDLVEQCRVELDGGPIQVAAYYGAATVDKDGNAYVPFTLPSGNPQAPGTRAVLLKVTPGCQYTILAEVPNSRAFASPTLADDQYVLFATNGRLGIYTLDGQLVREYTLGSASKVAAAPVIQDGVIYVLSSDATLTIIRNSGLSGYGTAYWPRYRQNNYGTGTAAQDTDADGVPDTADPEDDGDGYTDTAEAAMGTDALDNCGSHTTTPPIYSMAWPADLYSATGVPPSTDRISVQDLTSYIAPVRRINSSPGDAGFHIRWDIVPGAGVFSKQINVADISSLISVAPDMFGGQRAFNGPSCTP